MALSTCWFTIGAVDRNGDGTPLARSEAWNGALFPG